MARDHRLLGNRARNLSEPPIRGIAVDQAEARKADVVNGRILPLRVLTPKGGPRGAPSPVGPLREVEVPEASTPEPFCKDAGTSLDLSPQCQSRKQHIRHSLNPRTKEEISSSILAKIPPPQESLRDLPVGARLSHFSQQ